ncbi:MAG: hypothetical protein COY57_03800 [Flavobacteriales bacterium CG_4_10_14_0_8_um_filter_32_5]|nr:MAG: hypothetical protein COY57_03800 [Flavobacteriales bacterium CG_4_10_14_0_8_um_filter_32_5]
MKNLIYIKLLMCACLLLLIQCKAPDVSLNSSQKLKKNEYIIKLIEIENRKTKQKELFVLLDDKKYFIKFSESALKHEDARNYLNKNSIGKIKFRNGYWEEQKPVSLSNPSAPTKARSGDYVILLKIKNQE